MEPRPNITTTTNEDVNRDVRSEYQHILSRLDYGKGVLVGIPAVLNAERVIFFIWSALTISQTPWSVFTGCEWLSTFSIELCYWHTKFYMAWHRRIWDTFYPCSWSSQSAASTVSKHQSLGGADLQAFRSRWPDLSGCWIAEMERVVRRPCNSAVTVNLQSSLCRIPLT